MKFILIILTGLTLISCNKKTEVSWPELSELDNLSILVEQAAYEHKHEKQKELLLQAKSKIEAVTTTTPKNAHNTEKVRILLSDLEALSTKITNLPTLEQNDLDTLSRGIHPIVSRLMETSGVPHVHEGVHGHDASTCNDPSHNH